MTQKGFMKIFWGLLIIILDIRIYEIDVIIPDFVGYIFILNGLRILSSVNSRFDQAKIFAYVMVFLSLTDLVELQQLISKYDKIIYLSYLFYCIESIGAVLTTIMIWHICVGIHEIATASDNKKLAKTANKMRNLYLAAVAFAWWNVHIFISTNRLIFVIVILKLAFYIIGTVLIMILIRKASKEIITYKIEPDGMKIQIS